MANMNKGEETILEFFRIDELINNESLKCMTPYIEDDDNVGGGKANFISNPTASKGEKLAESLKLRNLREIERCVGGEYSRLTGFSKEVIDLYFSTGGKSRRTDKQVKEITQIPVNHLKNIRVDFTIKVCNKMGY